MVVVSVNASVRTLHARRWPLVVALAVLAACTTNPGPVGGGGDTNDQETDTGGDACEWFAQTGGDGLDEPTGMVQASSGDLYVTGVTRGDFEDQQTAGASDAFVARWSLDGQMQWSRQLGTSEHDNAKAIAADAEDNVYIAGWSEGSIDGASEADPWGDAFVAKYDAGGSLSWTRQFGTDEDDDATAIAVAGDALYVGGTTAGALDGGLPPTAVDAFLVSFDLDGTQQWSLQLGEVLESDTVVAVVPDAANTIFMAGLTAGQFDGETGFGDTDLYVTRRATDGSKIWTRLYGTPGHELASTLTIDDNGHLYLVGGTEGTVGDEDNLGLSDFFVIKIDADGNELWTRQFGGLGWDSAWGATTSATNDLYITGRSDDQLYDQPAYGDQDIFVVKIDLGGNLQWARTLGTDSFERGIGIVASDDDVYIAGLTHGEIAAPPVPGGTDVVLAKLCAP